MNKSKIYLDLSKCTEEELKNIYIILGDTLKFESPSIVFNFPIMHYHESIWIRTNFFQDKAKEDNFLEDKTEITYAEFIKLFEGGETDEKGQPMTYWGGKPTSKEVLQVENNGSAVDFFEPYELEFIDFLLNKDFEENNKDFSYGKIKKVKIIMNKIKRLRLR